MLAIAFTVVGCTPTPAPPPTGSDEFQRLLDTSMAELQLKTEAHKAWGLGSFDQWNIDQDAGTLVFSNADGTTVTAPVQIIGSFNSGDNTWLWAWDNPSIEERLTEDAQQLKQYGEQHGIERLTSPSWTGDEADGWAMAAFAVKLCEAQGAYRAPAGSTYVFVTFGEVRIVKGDNGA